MKTLLFASVAIVMNINALSAMASELACTDTSGSNIRIVNNPYQRTNNDKLIILNGSVVLYLFQGNILDSLIERYPGHAGYPAAYAKALDEDKVIIQAASSSSYLAANGGRYEFNIVVKQENSSVRIYADGRNWFFSTCMSN